MLIKILTSVLIALVVALTTSSRERLMEDMIQGKNDEVIRMIHIGMVTFVFTFLISLNN